MTLEEEIAESIAKDMARQIDDDIMSSMLVEIGWIPVEFHFKDNNHSNDVTFWLLEHCKSKWRRIGQTYLFEDRKEAEWFILRWL